MDCSFLPEFPYIYSHDFAVFLPSPTCITLSSITVLCWTLLLCFHFVFRCPGREALEKFVQPSIRNTPYCFLRRYLDLFFPELCDPERQDQGPFNFLAQQPFVFLRELHGAATSS